MIVLLEGPELAGKTTLATFLGKLFNVTPVKYIVTDDASMRINMDNFKQRMKHDCNSQITILDRFHFPSEIIYHPIFNDGKQSSIFDPDTIEEWKQLYAQHRIFVLYIHADAVPTEERYNIRKDPYLSVEQCIESVHLYRTKLRSLIGAENLYSINTSRLTIQEMCYMAADAITEEFIARQNEEAR